MWHTKKGVDERTGRGFNPTGKKNEFEEHQCNPPSNAPKGSTFNCPCGKSFVQDSFFYWS